MAFMDGKPKRSGGNVQREKFAAGMSGTTEGSKPTRMMPEGERGMPTHQGEEGTTTITHHGDGSHTVQHHDGETTEHPHAGHMLMGLHSKHMGDEGMHVHKHDGMPSHPHDGMEPHHMVTTHHVGMDGQVEGPHHHESMDAAAEHMKSVLGEDGGNGADMAMHENPEDESYLG